MSDLVGPAENYDTALHRLPSNMGKVKRYLLDTSWAELELTQAEIIQATARD